MMNMTAKVSFELTKDGKVTIEVRGDKAAVKAGIMAIVEKVAEIEEVSMEEFIAEMQRANEFAKKDPGEIFAEVLSKLFGDDEEPEDCDRDCDNCDKHQEMPEEMKEFLNKMFGGLN